MDETTRSGTVVGVRSGVIAFWFLIVVSPVFLAASAVKVLRTDADQEALLQGLVAAAVLMGGLLGLPRRIDVAERRVVVYYALRVRTITAEQVSGVEYRYPVIRVSLVGGSITIPAPVTHQKRLMGALSALVDA